MNLTLEMPPWRAGSRGHVARQALVTAAGPMQLCSLFENEQCLL